MNDLQNIPNLDAHPKLFADDTNVFVYAKNLTALNTKGMLALESISEWMTANKLSINYCISCYMMFSFSKVHDFPNKNINLSIYGHTLAQVRSTKYLGLNVDENLNWKGHIKDVYNNIIKYTSIFYKLRSKLPVCVLKQLYFATIYPALLYGIQLYANTYSSYLSDLMTLNNKLLRILLDKPLTTAIGELYFAFNTLPIDKLFDYIISYYNFLTS